MIQENTKEFTVKINKNNSIMLGSLEQLNLGVWISHGEGNLNFLKKIII